MALIVLCVALISIGDPAKQVKTLGEGETAAYDGYYMQLAVIVSLINGFNFAFNLFITKVMLSRYNFTSMQLNFDVCFA